MNFLAYYNTTPRSDWIKLPVLHNYTIWQTAQLWMAPLHVHSATELDDRCSESQCNIIVAPTGCLVTDDHISLTIPPGEIDGGIFGVLTNRIRFDHDIKLSIYYNN